MRTWSEVCANGELRRVALRKGATVEDVAEGYLHGYAYVFTYEHAANRRPDDAALAALSAVCRPSAPAAI